MKWKFQSILALAICGFTLAVDLTREEKAKGLDVVHATLKIIADSQIFSPDSNFLYRLASVETKFGSDEDTFTSTEFRGIWRLSREDFAKTKSTSLSTLHSDMQSKLGIDWLNTTWEELNVPLYSVIAARLLAETFPEPIPSTKAEQADYWQKYYRKNKNGNEASALLKASLKLSEEEAPSCEGKLDIAIALGGSERFSNEDFETAKVVVTNLLSTFSSNPELVRKAFLVFSSESKFIFNLTNNFDAAKMKQKIAATDYPRNGTNINGAIETAVKVFQAAPERRGVPRVLLIFTDGKSDGSVIDIGLAEEADITPFVIIVGESDYTMLLPIALGYQSRIHNVEDFDDLAEYLPTLQEKICRMTQNPWFTSETDPDDASNPTSFPVTMIVFIAIGIVFVLMLVGIVLRIVMMKRKRRYDRAHVKYGRSPKSDEGEQSVTMT